MECQPGWGYFLPRILKFSFTEYLYLHIFIVCYEFLHTVIYHVFLSNTNNLQGLLVGWLFCITVYQPFLGSFNDELKFKQFCLV